MSQSAENQSAIIENENNSNIVFEAQAARPGDAENQHATKMGSGLETPTHDEADDMMEVEEGIAEENDHEGSRAEVTDLNTELITDAGDSMQGLEESPNHPEEVDSETHKHVSSTAAIDEYCGREEDMEVEELEQQQPESVIDGSRLAEAKGNSDDSEGHDWKEDLSEPVCAGKEEEGLSEQQITPENASFEEQLSILHADPTGSKNTAEAHCDSVQQDLETEVEQEDKALAENQAESGEFLLTAEAHCDSVQQDLETEVEQEDKALAENQAESGEFLLTDEDEDRLLADENSQLQKAADDENVESIEGQHLIEKETLLTEGQSSVKSPDKPEIDEIVSEVSNTFSDDVRSQTVETGDGKEELENTWNKNNSEQKDMKISTARDLAQIDQASPKAADNENIEQDEVIIKDEVESAAQNDACAIEAASHILETESKADADISNLERPEKYYVKSEALETEKEAEESSPGTVNTAAAESAKDIENSEHDSFRHAQDNEAERTSDATIDENRDPEDEPMLQMADVISGAEDEMTLKKDETNKESAHTVESVKIELMGETLSAVNVDEESDSGHKEADKNATDDTGADKTATDDTGADKTATDDTGADKTATDDTGADKNATDDTGADKTSTKDNGAESIATEDNGADSTAAEDVTNAKTSNEISTTSMIQPVEEDDDVVVLDDDDEELAPQVKKEVAAKELFNSSNDMGIQIESVSGGADEFHGQAEQNLVKQENGIEQKASPVKKEPQYGTLPGKKNPAKAQTCIVCKRTGKCKYNIVRNGDIKHLCDDTCFKRFRTNPTMFLKGVAATPGSAPVAEKKGKASSKTVAGAAVVPASQPKSAVTSFKTCVVCQLMNINTQGQFCMWKGLDFCGEGCLGKFQSGISTFCTLCTSFIPLTARSTNCLRLGNEVRPFCSSRCYADYKIRLRLCAFCQKDLSSATDSFSAPVGSEGSFKDFCTQSCMKKYEDLLNTDVEIIRVEAGKQRSINKCSVCQKNDVTKHVVKFNGIVNHLCSDPCLSAFQYANKLSMSSCDFCNTLCTSLESSPHTVQFEGLQKRFCSDTCVTKFRFNHRKVTPCSWCGSQRDNFDMIERLDSNSKYQLFCSLNCLSLYRVNLQAKSNQAVTCDQCLKFTPAQYHLTMSDASVRNFCSYSCVMSFQAQFSKAAQPQPPTPTPPPPRHKHNTRGRGNKGNQQQAATSPSFPIISNVVSLAPQGGQKVNIKNTTGVPVVVSGTAQNVKTTGLPNQAGIGPVQQQIIIQPPPPKQVKNKSLLCKPFVQTKATSCRPHTQSKDCQTDAVKDKPVLIPIPIPIYLPTPMAMYAAPAPTPVFIPIPIPVPIFIPTTRKSATSILKQIKEIQEKTPSDPLEAEILMMAAAVSADGKSSSDSETEDEILPEINRSKKRVLPVEEEDDDGDVMPLTTSKEEEGGEEDMISMALRMAEEMSGPIADLESAVEAMPINTEPPPSSTRSVSPEALSQEEEMNLSRTRRGTKRNSARRGAGRPPKRQRVQTPQPEPVNALRQEPIPPPVPPADANYHLKFTYGVNAWRHWVLFKNAQIERNMKPGSGRVKLFKTDILQCTADELNFSLCLFVKEVRKPNSDEYSPDSIYYLTLGIQQYLFENGRIDNIFADLYYEKFTECLTEILSKCQPKFNASGQMVCRIEEEHLWECKQLGAHSPYVLLNTLIYFHTKYFMLKTPEDHMKLSFAHILKYWKKGQPGKGGQPTRSVSLRYYSVSTAKKDGSAPTSTTKKGSKEGIPVYEVTENQENPLRCPVKLYEFYLSKCPESIKNRSDIFYPVPERSCVPDSPVWYSTMPISLDVMTKMLTRILLVREIQEAHLHAQPIYV